MLTRLTVAIILQLYTSVKSLCCTPKTEITLCQQKKFLNKKTQFLYKFNLQLSKKMPATKGITKE